MGATGYSTTAFGKDIDSAFDAARRQAKDENGHQEGYSGDIQCASGYVKFDLPKSMTLNAFYKMCREVEDVKYEFKKKLSKTTANHPDLVIAKRFVELTDDKCGPAVAFELTGKAAKDFRQYNGLAGKRGRVWRFSGTASC